MERSTRASDGSNAALFLDLYQLKMIQAYLAEAMHEAAVFDLHFRTMPADRNFMVACGVQEAVGLVENLHFNREALEYLSGLGHFSDALLHWLADFRFTGEIYGVRDGTPVFPEEPLVQVVAPPAQAQLLETLLMNQVHLQTLLASKATRIVLAARGRRVVDFSARRAHGMDAAVKGARAFYLAGLAGTSNLLASRTYGIPAVGTMAHSYIQAHDREYDAFRAFIREHPETILLVDTYDTVGGLDAVVALAEQMAPRFRVRGVRIDSGDLDGLAHQARACLNAAGLNLEIFVSGGLDEHQIAALLQRDAPIDGFGVGSSLGVSEDAPALDIAYKLTEYAGKPRIKTSPGKRTLPGLKQIYRKEEGGQATGDTIARAVEGGEGRPVVHQLMEQGRALQNERADLETLRASACAERERLPDRLRALSPADPPYPVELSRGLRAHLGEARQLAARAAAFS